MKFFNFIVTLMIFPLVGIGQTIHHQVAMPHPQSHYFHIQTTLTDFPEDKLKLILPVWTPGSYKIREFPKNINLVTAVDGKGNVLPLQKVRKNEWLIVKGNAEKVIVSYEYYAFEISVRTSFLDDTHGYLNGNNVFTYPDGYKELGGEITVIPHASFSKVTVPLPVKREGFASDNKQQTFTFNDYDQLADSPMEFGNQVTFDFMAAGIKHNVAMYGPGNYNVEQLKIDLAKIVEESTNIFGENPSKEYWFIIHNLSNGSGGLEHMNSTTLSVNRWTYRGDDYFDFLSLVAHEYFHVWNVKRLRPANLVDYDYGEENYTSLLWVSEGFTSYYENKILYRAGFLGKDEYINRYKGKINYVERIEGNKVQPVSHASYDAWIKAYHPNENSRNTTISYYSKGALIAGVFDAMIVTNSNGKKSLDDFMKKLYNKFYKNKFIGFTDKQFKKEMSKFVDENLDDFFEKYIYGTETIPYEKYFKPLGVQLEKKTSSVATMGFSASMEAGKLIVNYVRANSAAEKAGISPNDEIIAFNGFRVDKYQLDRYLSMLPPEVDFNLIISRDNKLMSVDAIMGTTERVTYTVEFEENKLSEAWLKKE